MCADLQTSMQVCVEARTQVGLDTLLEGTAYALHSAIHKHSDSLPLRQDLLLRT